MKSDRMKMPANVRRYAILSDCGRFRYWLARRWGPGVPLLFVMLNPSVADYSIDDATVRRCFGFADACGFSAFEIVNLFAYRATDPADLRKAGYPVGPENDDQIAVAAARAGGVVVAWGAGAAGLERPDVVLPILRESSRHPLMCLGLTRSGYPRHPLMLPRTAGLMAFSAETIQEAMTRTER